MIVLKLYCIYIISLSIITFFIYGCDKLLAIKRKRRISEHTLLLLSVIGGALGALIAMYLFHHKTRKRKFLVVNYFVSGVEVLILTWLYRGGF